MNAVHIRSAERALSAGTWLIVFGAMLYSVLTVTPLMAQHTDDRWDWTAPILPLVVDAAVVIVVKLDDVLARLGGNGGKWPVVLRWMTGLMTLALNTADAALRNDLVGMAVHAVAPLLLIVTAETGLAYRRAIAAAVSALEAAQKLEREQAELKTRERAERARREAREEREHDEAVAREQREHEAQLIREQADREERRAREEREARERTEAFQRDERERREREREQREQDLKTRERQESEQAEQARREQAEQAEREQRERAEQLTRERAALLERGPAVGKLPEDEARKVAAAAFDAGLSVRSAAELCGWSVGWVSARYAEHRDPGTSGTGLAIAGN
ncbi:DUF2637 domain-containing protein [Streptomyces sp. NPDC002688]|uniref:DUF2637 domain-containing protein n=1 Tax=Streptomyces sp. NPDC002688 TaxID=3154423 RepID=UPI003326D1BD